jgi:hypothetical protein
MQAVPINYLAVLVSGIVSMVLGYVWFGPLFGKMYIHLMGWDNKTPAEQEAMMKGMMKSYVITFIGSLVMAWVLAHAIIYAQVYMHWTALTAGLATGFMSWLGFVVPVSIGNVLWGNSSWKLWWLTNSHQLVQFLIFGAILGTWK